MNTSFNGQALAKAGLMRRTLTVTTAPIFRSLRRIDPPWRWPYPVPATSIVPSYQLTCDVCPLGA